ncbi:MAG: beta-ketoacyl-ACP synthase, partial [Lentisphaeria bacterium]|nr:beta-ketoacyl-ACP synthase [Lentisphaeria bacterium]
MNRNQRRVVITGIGVVSALGNTPDTLFANLLAGKSAVRMMADWPHPALAAPLAELPEAADIPRSMRRTMGNVALYCAAAGKAAARHAGITEFPDGRTLCAAGSTMGSSLVFEETFNTLLLGKGMADVSPMNFFKCAS